jgi:hypothetical protein
MRPVFDTGRGGYGTLADIDPSVISALIESGTALAKTGVEVGAAAAAAKREKDAKKKKTSSAPAPSPVVVAAAPRSAVPGWAIGLGAVAVIGVVGLILFLPKAAPARTKR